MTIISNAADAIHLALRGYQDANADGHINDRDYCTAIAQRLADAGLLPTQEEMAMRQIIADNPRPHIDVDEVFRQVALDNAVLREADLLEADAHETDDGMVEMKWDDYIRFRDAVEMRRAGP